MNPTDDLLVLPPHCGVLKAPHKLPDLLDPNCLPWDLGIVASTKFDGNRGLCIGGRLCTSSMEPPENGRLYPLLRKMIAFAEKHEWMFDYELYDPQASHHAVTSGGINSQGDELSPTLGCYVFDGMPLKDYYESAVYTPYGVRIHLYHAAVAKLKDARIQAVPQERMINASQLRHHFEKNIAAGLEGSIARSTEIDGDVTDLRRGLKGGWYKHGRATVNQSIIWKIKAYETLDGRIIGIQQRRQLRADVPRTYNAAGHLQKVHAKSAYEPIESVGAFEVEYLDPATRERSTSQVNFGPGFALFERELLWMKRDTLIGKWVEFKHMPHGAKKDGGLRIGQLLRFRDDLSGALQ